MTAPHPTPSDRVQVLYGRWAGRVGIYQRDHVNPGSVGGQQSQRYFVVRLDPFGRARARTVRVIAVRRLL